MSADFLFHQTGSLGILAEACYHQKKVKEGLACIKEALQLTTQIKETVYLSLNYKTQGDLLLLNHQPVEAEQSYQQAISVA